MAVAASFNTLKSRTISILQASQTAYATTVDGSNRQYSSDTEIADAILQVDGEIATAICQTIGSPYQSQFALTTAALASGSSITKNVGIVLDVQTYDGLAAESFLAAAVNTTTDTITISGTNFITGSKVQFTTSGVLPTGISASTDYWLIRTSSSTVKVASSYFNATYGTAIDITGAGSGTHTATPQYVDGRQAASEEEILQVNQNPANFGSLAAYVLNWWFIKGTKVFTTSPFCKVNYTDYILTSSPQAPESYTTAVIAGAVGKLLKDGSDAQMAAYYLDIYNQMMQSILAGAKATPEITQFSKAAGASNG